jgi:hypothetical protein
VFVLISPMVATALLVWKGLGWWSIAPAAVYVAGLIATWLVPESVWERISPDPHAEARRRLKLKDLLGGQDQKAIALIRNNATSDGIDAWIAETTQLIASAVGMGEATRFVSNAGLSGVQITPGMLQNDATNLAYRRQRLTDLISRVDVLAIEPNFEPSGLQVGAP